MSDCERKKYQNDNIINTIPHDMPIDINIYNRLHWTKYCHTFFPVIAQNGEREHKIGQTNLMRALELEHNLNWEHHFDMNKDVDWKRWVWLDNIHQAVNID